MGKAILIELKDYSIFESVFDYGKKVSVLIFISQRLTLYQVLNRF